MIRGSSLDLNTFLPFESSVRTPVSGSFYRLAVKTVVHVMTHGAELEGP